MSDLDLIAAFLAVAWPFTAIVLAHFISRDNEA